jgi:hypothetical protein
MTCPNNINVGDYGLDFIFFAGFNMANFTKLSITFTRPNGSTITVTSPAVTLGTNTIAAVVNGQAVTFLANQYVIYAFKNGDVNQDGLWSARVTYDDATPLHLISAPGTFTVNP